MQRHLQSVLTAEGAENAERKGKENNMRRETGCLLPIRLFSLYFLSSSSAVILPLRQQPRHHVAMHVGQAEVAALEAMGQLRVVEAEQVQ